MRKKTLVRRIGKDMDEIINKVATDTELSYTDASNILAKKLKTRRIKLDEIDF